MINAGAKKRQSLMTARAMAKAGANSKGAGEEARGDLAYEHHQPA
jgi:hypothetical protein